MVRRRDPGKAGFSLLEALVALAIGAMMLGAILGLQHQFIDAQRRHDATMQSSNLQRDVLALIKEVNPAERPDGEIALPPDRTIRWTSEAVSPPSLRKPPTTRISSPSPMTCAWKALSGSATAQKYEPRLTPSIWRTPHEESRSA